MKTRKTIIVILAALALATTKLVAQNAEAAPPKGGKAAAHMSVKGRANSNAQWSADPEKGWVRAEERQQIRDDKNSKRHQVNRKGNGSKKKSLSRA